MSDYKKFELIKLNISQFISGMKSRRKEKRLFWLDKIVQRILSENSGYDDLAPKADIENGQEYLDALFWGLKNENVKNIALTGPYGSGKSSIIQAYLKKYPRTKALNVSLATFDLKKENNDDFEKEIELGILKQLFYKVDSGKIPQSRYRKIKKIYYKRCFGVITVIIIVILFGVAFFAPNTIKVAMNFIENSGNYYGIKRIPSFVIASLFALLGIGGAAYVAKWCMSTLRVKEVNVADKATVTADKDDSSIFDKSMDELVYFFEATDFNVVFIEDLDRFDNTKIFVKLRELNTILNNYDLIKRRIVFVYAIKDDMFKNEERTKFFDFIIPVIPYITSTNSGEILKEKLILNKKQDDDTLKKPLFDISSSYITLISPFIEDMRVLINIYNEFIVYKNILKSVKLNDEEMFSMIIFKNLYPAEFSELEAEKGIVKQAFEDKKAFIKLKQMELDTERVELEQILNGIEKDISVRDVKAAFLNYLGGTNGPFISCNINGITYSYQQIMNDSFDLSKFKEIDWVDVSSYRGSGRKFDKFNSDEYVQKYLGRIDSLKNNEESRKNELRNRIEECNKSVAELYTFSLEKLIELYGSRDIFSEEVQENKFLVFLLRKGFINENYADYINYFHPKSITPKEMNFIRGIRMQEAVGDFSDTIENVEQVCERIETYEFKQIEILNYDIVDYLITKKRDSEQCKELFVGLSEGGEKFEAFTKAYIERKKNNNIFINLLCKRHPFFWNKIVNDKFLTEDKKFEYLALILKFADLDDISSQNTSSGIGTEDDEVDFNDLVDCGIFSFVTSNKKALTKLSSVSTERMIEVIEELEICFREIDIQGANKEVLKFIFENNYYKLNIHMLQSLFEFYFPDKIEQLETANYSVICDVAYEPLMKNLSDINKFKDYVSEMVVGQDSNTNESIDAVEDILERLFDIDLELCKKVLAQENVVWEHIKECCKCSDDKKDERKLVWDHVLTIGKVKESWDNFVGYYTDYTLTTVLVNWVNESMSGLIQQDRIEQLTDRMIKEIINENISADSLDELTKAYSIEKFDCSLSEFDSDRIAILIKNKYIPYSSKYLNAMYEVAPEQVSNYLICNKKDFIQDITSVELEISTIVELLRSGSFENNEINKLLELVSISDMNRDMAIEIQKLEILVKKEYVEKAWDLLEEGERYQLLLNQLENYSIKEISSKLAKLAPVYQNLSDCSKKHREYLPLDDYGYNDKLLGKLKDIGYLSSMKIDEYYEEDIIAHKKIKKQRFEVWVKKQ